MKSEISKFVKSYNPSVIIRNKVFGNHFKCCVIDWIDKNNYYYSFCAMFNSTQIFTKEQVKLGEFQDAIALSKNVRIFSNKEDWVNNKWSLKELEKLQMEIDKALKTLQGFQYEGYGYRVLQVAYVVDPIIMFTIAIENQNGYVNTIAIVLNQVTLIECKNKDYFFFLSELVETLRLEKYVRLQHVESQEQGDADNEKNYKEVISRK